MDEQVRQTAKVWEADLGDIGRKLTLDELQTLEMIHICQNLARLVVAQGSAGLHLASLEGRMDRLEQYLTSIDPRYPRSSSPFLDDIPALETRP